MKYYKTERIHDEYTTYSVVMPDLEGEIQGFVYTTIDNVDYIGIDLSVEELKSWLASQAEQITLTELTFQEIVPILKQSHLYRSINERVLTKIREQYSIENELKAGRMGRDKSMDAYIAECVAWGDEQKRLIGLK